MILTLAALAFGIAYYAGMHQPSHRTHAPPIQGIAIDPPAPVPVFQLWDQRGDPFTREDLLDTWSLLLLDPGDEPMPSPALIHLMQVHNRLAGQPQLQNAIHFIYLPRRDAAALGKQIDRLGSHLTGLSGEPESVDAAFREFGVETDGSQALIFLIGPDQRLHALFTQSQDAATIAQDLTQLIEALP
ncbi:MAG: SCO family protein [Candidatus Thiodiazotropha sp.]